MALGLRPKQGTDYRALLGLKPAKSGGARRRMDEDYLQLEVDKEGEWELLREILASDGNEELELEDELLAADMDPEEILRLAQEEEEKCKELEKLQQLELHKKKLQQ